MIDIGTNFHSKQMHGMTDALVRRAREKGVQAILATGTSLQSSQQAATLAKEHSGYIWATAGVHPHTASQWNSQTLAAMEKLWAKGEVVAVGECGLDYNRMFSPKDAQTAAFSAHIEAAVRTKMPLFMHCRDAFDDFYAMTREAAQAGATGVVHCFTGTASEAVKHLENGFDIGITGWIADARRGTALREALSSIPLDRLHLETDAPYLMPQNSPSKGRFNEPANLVWVAKAIAELKGLDCEEVTAQCTLNSVRLFGLSDLA